MCVWHGCDYRTADASDRKVQTNTHTGEKHYVCVWHGCDYRASRASTLKRHTNTHP